MFDKCKYCIGDGSKNMPLDETNSMKVYIHNDRLIVEYFIKDSSRKIDSSRRINLCPMCGRKLHRA